MDDNLNHSPFQNTDWTFLPFLPGHEEIIGSDRDSFARTCRICKPGYYNNAPNKDPCKRCRGGVICLEGATTDSPLENGTGWGVEVTKSYLCPRGYYCESGDITPRPCRNGTYNPYLNASSPLHCQLCAINHFNHLQAQNACFPCGSSASAKHLGSDTCSCNGLHRVFMVSRIINKYNFSCVIAILQLT